MPKKEKSKMDTTILVAIIGLIGTLGAALLGSPLLIAMLEKKNATPTPTLITETPPTTSTEITSSPATTVPTANPVVFETGFDNGSLDGISVLDGTWDVVQDAGNQVLSVDGSTGQVFGYALYGPKDFSNGIIEFRVKFTDTGAGSFYALFRQQDSNDAYAFMITPGPKKLTLGKFLSGNQIEVVPFASNTEGSYTINRNQWYIIKLELTDTEIQVYVNGELHFTGYDALFKSGELAFVVGKKSAIMLDDIKVTETK